ncbi:MAG: LTA synthase family protein [Bacilli bacterium]
MVQKFGNRVLKKIKNYFENNQLFLAFLFTSIINSTLLRFLTVKNYFDFRAILSDLAVVMIIGSFGYLIKLKNRFKYYFGWSIFFSVLCIINSMYYTNYMSFASVSLIATSSQIVDVGDAVVNNVMKLNDFCYLWQIIAMMLVNSYLKKKQYYQKIIFNFKKDFKKTIKMALIVFVIFVFTLQPSDWGKFGKQWNREFVVMKFGLYLYQINDIVGSIKPQLTPLFGYDRALKEYREFYQKQTNAIIPNEYTNIFKGKNILSIHAESIQNFVINEKFNNIEVTPFLNKLSKNGLYFSNFYAQESVGTSSDSEFTLNSSLLPASNGTVFINYFNRNYLTIPKLLKKQDYYSFSMHGNDGAFWNRNVVHEKLGYDKFYYLEKDYNLDEKLGLGLSDKSFFKQSIKYIKEISQKNKNFYGTMLMLTNHTPFTALEKTSNYKVTYEYINNLGEKVIDNYLEGTTLGNYFKSVNYADNALEQLITDLDKEGILDNTVIIIYGDHDNKLKKKEYQKYYNYNLQTGKYLTSSDEEYYDFNFYEYELNRKVPFIIWSKNTNLQKEIKEVMGMIDILPTLGNMFGFNNYYALGHDIFSVNENVVVFPDGNWVTNQVYYNSQKEESYSLTKEAVSKEYIDKFSKYANKIISVSNDIIIHNLIENVDLTKK